MAVMHAVYGNGWATGTLCGGNRMGQMQFIGVSTTDPNYREQVTCKRCLKKIKDRDERLARFTAERLAAAAADAKVTAHLHEMLGLNS